MIKRLYLETRNANFRNFSNISNFYKHFNIYIQYIFKILSIHFQNILNIYLTYEYNIPFKKHFEKQFSTNWWLRTSERNGEINREFATGRAEPHIPTIDVDFIFFVYTNLIQIKRVCVYEGPIKSLRFDKNNKL